MGFADLIDNMETYARPRLTQASDLRAFNSRRNEAAHPRDSLIRPDMAFLKQALVLTDTLFQTYAGSVDPDWGKVMDEMTRQATFVELQPLNGLKAYPSTVERRCVWLRNKSPMDVLKPGIHRPGLFARFDEVAFVSMVPRRIGIGFSPNTLSRDRVPIDGEATLDVVIKDEEAIIKRAVINAIEEEGLLRDAFAACISAEVAGRNYSDLHSSYDDLNKEITARLKDRLTANCSIFQVIGVLLLRISAADTNVNEAALERVHQAEQAATEKADMEREREKSRLQAEIRQQKLDDEAAVERKRLQTENALHEERYEYVRLELERQKQTDQYQQALALDNANIEAAIEKAKIAVPEALIPHLQTESGKLAFFAKDEYELRRQEIERDKFRLDREFDLQKEETRQKGNFKSGLAEGIIRSSPLKNHYVFENLTEPESKSFLPSPEGKWATELAALSHHFAVKTDGKKIFVHLDSGGRIEVDYGQTPPLVSRIIGDARSPIEIPWWDPEMSLSDIVVRCSKQTEG